MEFGSRSRAAPERPRTRTLRARGERSAGSGLASGHTTAVSETIGVHAGAHEGAAISPVGCAQGHETRSPTWTATYCM